MVTRRLSGLIMRLGIAVGIGLQAMAPLHAQSVSAPTPPVRNTIDANSVDLQTGFLALHEDDLSIGTPGNGGLSHSRDWVVQQDGGDLVVDGVGTGGWRHGFEITARMDGYTNTMIISGGGYSRVFVGTSPNVFPATVDGTHMGASLAYYLEGGNWTKLVDTLRDGTIINFDSALLKDNASYTAPAGYLATKITKPDGEVIDFTYKRTSYNRTDSNGNTTTYYVVRLQSVSNNYGYMLKYSYLSNDPNSPDNWLTIGSVSAINLASAYCDPAADACAGSWPTVSYGTATLQDATGAPYSAQIVSLPSGRTITYKVMNQLRYGNNYVRILGVKDPSSSSFDLEYAYNSSDITRAQIVGAKRHGVQYDYKWLKQTDSSTSYITAWVSSANMRKWTAQTDLATGRLKMMAYGGAFAQDSSGYTNIDDYFDAYSYDDYGRLNLAQRNGGAASHTLLSQNLDDRGNSGNVLSGGKIYHASYDGTCSNIKTCNQPISTSDSHFNVTNFTYDSVHGGVLTMTSPAATAGAARSQVRTTYAQLFAYYKDASGSLVQAPTGIWKPVGTSACATNASCVGTADEVKTTITYGAAGAPNNLLPTATTTAAGDGSISQTVTVAYDLIGNKVSEDGPLPGSADTTVWAYDADRRVTQVTGPDPDGTGPLHNRSVKTTYNASGQAASVSTGTSNPDGSGFVELSRVDTSFDAYSRRVSTTVTAGGIVQARTDYSYDTFDRLACTAVRMNPAAFATASTPACSLGAQGGFGPDRISHNVYDTYDRVQKVQTGYGLPYQRDEVTYAYGGDLVTAVTDAKGNRTKFGYDTRGRRVSIAYPSPTNVGQVSATDIEYWWYEDSQDLLKSHQLRDGKEISYSYDNLGRTTLAHMVNPVDGNDRDIATSYDLLGRVTQVDDGAGKRVSYVYDALGRKLSEAPQLTGGATSYQYDAAGRRTRLTWSDGFYVTYDYDTLGELLAIRENGATSGPGVLASFAYDEQGKPTGLIRGNGVNDSYSYDAASRLAGLTITHPTAGNVYGFAYNPANQLVSRSMSNDAYAFTQAVAVSHNYTVNGLNQYTASGSVVPTYDGRGNMTSAGSITYVYDSKNQLTTFGSNSLGYDAAGRLASQATPATRFVYDGSDLIAETDASNAILRRYVHIPGTDNVLVWYEGAGTSDRRWLAHDERGSTTLITDGSGNSLGINAYDEYGIPQSTNLGRFQYTGQTWLPELGMHYYKARMYSPSFGRFMQTDPIGYDDGLNWYNYVKGDPINGADPSGLDACTSTFANSVYKGFLDGHSEYIGQDPYHSTTISYQCGGAAGGSGDYYGYLGYAAASGYMHYVTNVLSGTKFGPLEVPDGGAIYNELLRDLRISKFVGSAAKPDPDVNFARSPLIFQEALKSGQMFHIPSDDYKLGSILLQANATRNGVDGVVEYLMPLNNDFFSGRPIVTHARFVPGAPISGYVNNYNGEYHPPYCPPPGCA